MQRWRLNSVEINGFRGVAGKQSFDFLGKNGLLFGPNGQGKSTVALAIQWAVFGKFPAGILQNTRFSSFLRSQSNAGGPYSVRVVFKRGEQTMAVYREDGTKRKCFELEIDGQRHEDVKAEDQRDALIGMDLDTFARLILLHQGRVRGLLMDEPSERRAAMDKLLGVDAIADIAAELKPKRFEDRANALLAAEKDKVLRLEEQERMLTNLRSEAQDKARKYGFQSRHFTLSGLKAELTELGAAVSQTAADYHVTVAAFPPCAAVEDGPRVCKALRAAIAQMRMEADVRAQLARLDREIAVLKDFGCQWLETFESKAKAESGLREHETAAGADDVLERKTDELAIRLEQTEKELKSFNALNALLRDALDYIEATGSKECPACALPLGAELVRARARNLGNEATLDLEAARKQAREALDAHANLRRVRSQLREEYDRRSHRAEQLRQKATTLGELGVGDAKVPARVDELLRAKGADRDKLAQGSRVLEESLHRLEQRVAAISEHLLPALTLTNKLADLEQQRKNASKGGAVVSQKVARLRSLGDQIGELKRVLIEVKEEHAKASLQAAGPRAQKLYSSLVDHAFFDTLSIETEEKAGSLGYTYRLSKGTAGPETVEARLVLSDGQMTAAALALFYGLAASAEHSFDLLFIDDPTQNLDDRRKEAMAGALVQIAQHKQVIVSTHDEDFFAKLDDAGFRNQAITFRFRDWNGQPQVTHS